MKRFAGVLLVLAIFGVGYLFGACSGGNNAGSSAGMQGTALAQELSKALVSEVAEPKWHGDFDKKVGEQRVMKEGMRTYDNNAKAVPLIWLLKVVNRNIDRDEKNLIFVVTDANDRVMAVKDYKLYIRGYDSDKDLSWAEDFPPVIYP
jgi:hypothetical protein